MRRIHTGKESQATRPLPRPAGLLAAVFLALVVACGPANDGDRADAVAEDRPAVDRLALGEDVCAFCEEIIEAQRYGGELVTREGETYRFMSVECLAGFLLDRAIPAEDIRSLRVVDFNHGGRLIDARSAIYLRPDMFPGPMALDFLAVDDQRIADNLHFAYGGNLMDWDAVLTIVAREWEI